MTITFFHKVNLSAAELADTVGLVTVAVECQPQYDATNGVLSADAERQGRDRIPAQGRRRMRPGPAKRPPQLHPLVDPQLLHL